VEEDIHGSVTPRFTLLAMTFQDDLGNKDLKGRVRKKAKRNEKKGTNMP
jgi:hypothetical protein